MVILCTFARDARSSLATAHTALGRLSQLHEHWCSNEWLYPPSVATKVRRRRRGDKRHRHTKPCLLKSCGRKNLTFPYDLRGTTFALGCLKRGRIIGVFLLVACVANCTIFVYYFTYRNPRLSACSGEIRSKAVYSGIFFRPFFSNFDQCRSELAGDVISGMAVGPRFGQLGCSRKIW